MKIIKRGKIKEELFTGTCFDCDSVLEAKRSELKIIGDMRDGSELGQGECPVCKSDVNFYPK